LIVFACAVDAQTIPTFQSSQLAAGCPNSQLAQVLEGDFNGDHKQDLVFYCGMESVTLTPGSLIVVLGNGDGTFQNPVVTQVPNESGNLYAADLNGDGKTDLIYGEDVLGRFPPPNPVDTFLATGNGNFRPVASGLAGIGSDPLVLGDVNDDGILDVIDELGSVYYPGKGDGTFSSFVPLPALPAADDCAGRPTVVVTDLNGDGIPDLVIGKPCDSINSTYAFLGTGRGSYAAPVRAASLGGEQLAVGDFNNDGKPDLLIGNYATSALYTVFGNGDGTFQAPKRAAGSFLGLTLVADFNGDGNLDLAIPASSPAVAILLGQGDGTFQPIANPVPVSPNKYYAFALGDFNGDGKPDLATPGGTLLINTTVFASVTGVLNGASFAKGQAVAPGALVSVFGSFPGATQALAGSIPLPDSLGQVSVTIDGTTAPMLFANGSQLNVQMPWEAAAGTAKVVVNSNGAIEPSFNMTVQAEAPGIFTTASGLGQAIAINPDGSLAGPSGSIPGLAMRPANQGDQLIILATGLGAVIPSIADGAASSDTLRTAVTMPTVTIGGTTAKVSFAGLSPQFVGVNQINVTVPSGVSGVVPLQMSSGGAETSDQVTVAIAAE
jgi:uncharacterized protein (TIGR03437 family)